MYCKQCGTQLPEGTKFCTSCGAEQGVTIAKNTEARRLRRRKGYKMLVGPPVIFAVVLMLWGLINIIATVFDAQHSAGMEVVKILIPIIILFAVACVPIGIVVGLVYIFTEE